MRLWFLLREWSPELQLGLSRERQLDLFDFLESIDILLEYFTLAS